MGCNPAKDRNKVRGMAFEVFFIHVVDHVFRIIKVRPVADDKLYFVFVGQFFQIMEIVVFFFTAGGAFDIHNPDTAVVDPADILTAVRFQQDGETLIDEFANQQGRFFLK